MFKLNVIGGGKMGSALLSGILGAKVLDPSEVAVSERLETAHGALTDRFRGVTVVSTIQVAEAYLLAVKPAQILEVAQTIARLKGSGVRPSVISIAAGVSLGRLRDAVGDSCEVIRAMPNTAALVGESMTGLVFGDAVPEEIRNFCRSLFGSVGETVEIPEYQMDALTAISGSGPAYFYLFCEAMEEAGLRLGLPLDVSRRLTRQTIKGAALMAADPQSDLRALRLDVTSPGGTTAEAIAAFEARGLRDAVFAATLACANKAQQISGN